MSAPVTTPGAHQPRLKDDSYMTPPALALRIAQHVAEVIGAPGVIVEPSAGTGAFLRAAQDTWPGVRRWAVEPNPQPLPAGLCELSPVTWEQWEPPMTWAAPAGGIMGPPDVLILGNPPFSLAEEHIRLALRLLPEGGHLCFLLRASILASQGRVRGLWRQYPPLRVWHVAPRPSFTGGGTDTAEYVVVLWEKGYRGDYAGGWLEWER